MTAPATIRQADLKRMAAIANADNVRVEVEENGRIIRVFPNIPATSEVPAVDADISFGGNSLSEWRARHESKPRGNPSSKKTAR